MHARSDLGGGVGSQQRMGAVHAHGSTRLTSRSFSDAMELGRGAGRREGVFFEAGPSAQWGFVRAS